MHITFRSELGDNAPTVDGYIKPCSLNGKIRVWTKLQLSGRGIHRTRTLQSHDLVASAQQWVGFHEYEISKAAADKLPYTFAEDVLLD